MTKHLSDKEIDVKAEDNDKLYLECLDLSARVHMKLHEERRKIVTQLQWAFGGIAVGITMWALSNIV